MKQLIIAIMFISCLTVSAFATVGDGSSDGESVSPEVVATEGADSTSTEPEVIEDLTSTGDSVEGESASDSGTSYSAETITEEVYIYNTDEVLTGINTYAGSTYSSSNTTGLKAALLGLIGDYEAVIVDYEYTNSSTGDVSYVREVQPDFTWIASAALVLLFIFCLFKLGVALCKK